MNKPKKFFSDNEKALLAELVSKYKLIEVKDEQGDGRGEGGGGAALTVEFNSIHGFYKRDEAQLRKCWDNLKTKWKKEKAVENQNRIATGGGPPGAGMSQLSVLVGAAAPHMARRVQNNTDSDGRLADQPLFTVAQILEPMVLPQADDLSLDCIPGIHVWHGDFCPEPQTGTAPDEPPPRHDVTELAGAKS
ncbi:hypothetical protein HPB47_019727 [Ixodes persulcatus]|uniref:Uncharacterized protein n=1 Tax=Ixodes persulcatus TaxID=34615 RepID=A0AC60QIA9_IXOPE|nr:hypothetical protein HPB47_019727 [Ixodes persulcatus]